MRVGILTSGGDCQALNATMRGLALTLYIPETDPQRLLPLSQRRRRPSTRVRQPYPKTP